MKIQPASSQPSNHIFTSFNDFFSSIGRKIELTGSRLGSFFPMLKLPLEQRIDRNISSLQPAQAAIANGDAKALKEAFDVFIHLPIWIWKSFATEIVKKDDLALLQILQNKLVDSPYLKTVQCHAFTEAVMREKQKLVCHLVKSGESPNHVFGNGETPLSYASRQQNPGLTLWLLKQGADVNKPVTGGWTPLMLWADVNDKAMVKSLMKFYDASGFAKNDNGMNTCQLAYSRGFYEIAAMLYQKGIPFK
ncbi:MAG: hypothetical protein CMD81_07445 [Gammaproteobacteria bacterium]|nr:hypothetical protein [Gammaproteobacteria bacterium]|tara:strand:+ start:2215 stop:2961 length:747 start_codon:yes stop_codon:yes gene_type:complete